MSRVIGMEREDVDLNWIERLLAGFCEHDDELSVSVKTENFFIC
jgi:hypothetical protein